MTVLIQGVIKKKGPPRFFWIWQVQISFEDTFTLHNLFRCTHSTRAPGSQHFDRFDAFSAKSDELWSSLVLFCAKPSLGLRLRLGSRWPRFHFLRVSIKQTLCVTDEHKALQNTAVFECLDLLEIWTDKNCHQRTTNSSPAKSLWSLCLMEWTSLTKDGLSKDTIVGKLVGIKTYRNCHSVMGYDFLNKIARHKPWRGSNSKKTVPHKRISICKNF